MWKCSECGGTGFYETRTQVKNMYDCEYLENGVLLDYDQEEEEEEEVEIICYECRDRGTIISEIAEWVE